jgi:hypothetical protein
MTDFGGQQMNIRSLLLGSVAAAGLATGAHAADLAKGVMTSLDVCDALGLSGLTVSSDTNCLQVTGGVSYQFAWGDYKYGVGSAASGQVLGVTPDDSTSIAVAGDASGTTGRATDWDSQMIAWLQVVGTADSDFGPAKVVIKLKSEQYRHTFNGVWCRICPAGPVGYRSVRPRLRVGWRLDRVDRW